jgi:hypothetical protein
MIFCELNWVEESDGIAETIFGASNSRGPPLGFSTVAHEYTSSIASTAIKMVRKIDIDFILAPKLQLFSGIFVLLFCGLMKCDVFCDKIINIVVENYLSTFGDAGFIMTIFGHGRKQR